VQISQACIYKKIKEGESYSVTAICQLDEQRPLIYQVYTGPGNGVLHRQFMMDIGTHLASGSCVFLDGCSFHFNAASMFVYEYYQHLGLDTKQLPPFSPTENPIELIWHKVKQIIKKSSSEMPLLHLIFQALNSVTYFDVFAAYKKCGYNLS